MIRVLVAILLVCQVNFSLAENRWFGGVQFGAYSFESDDQLIEFNPRAVGVLLGYEILDFLAVEARAGAGLGTDEDTLDALGVPVEVDYKLDYYLSFYVRPQYHFKYATIYALAGYGGTEFSATAEGYNVDESGAKSGISYGVGIGYTNADRVRFILEYISLVDTDTYSVEGTNFSVQFNF